jgi:hypothetical protein
MANGSPADTADRRSHDMTKLRRTAPALLCVMLAAVVPGTALADRDPLLSGYGGPGGGEQVILGSKLLPGGGGGGGGGSAGGGTLRAASPSHTAGEPATSSSTPSADPAGAAPAERPQGKRKHGKGAPAAADDPAPAAAAPATNAAAPPVIPYPTRAGSAGGLPVSEGDVVLILLGAAALILVALGLRRLAPTAEAPR